MDSDNNIQKNAKLEIIFPKSDQDHRLQLISINGSIFAIVFSALESQGPINLNCEEWSLILLAPIKSKANVDVTAINIICLNEIVSEEGNVNVQASDQLVKFSKPSERSVETGGRGEAYFDEDAGALMYYYSLFNNILTNVHANTPESFAEAQQQFISSLCTLANKIEGSPENLNLDKVFSIWNIPHLE